MREKDLRGRGVCYEGDWQGDDTKGGDQGSMGSTKGVWHRSQTA